MILNGLIKIILYCCACVAITAQSNTPGKRALQNAVRASGKFVRPSLRVDDPVKVDNMLTAIRDGNTLLVSKLLDDWPLNARIGGKKRTIAHYAVTHNKPAVLDLLVHHDADLNKIDVDGYTPYDIWLETYAELPDGSAPKQDEIGTILQENKALGAEAVSRGKKYYHDLFTGRLFEVTEAGNRKLVERFLSLGANPLQATLAVSPTSRHESNEGKKQKQNGGKLVHTLPIHLSIENAYPAITAILLSAMNIQRERMATREFNYTYDSPDVWGVYYKSWSPLQWAIFAEDWAMVDEFLHNGATLNHLNREISVGLNEESLARYDGSLMNHGGIEYHSSRMDAYDTAEFIGATDKLLTAIKTNKREDLIVRLIHKASTTGRTEIYDKLIAHGVNLRDGDKSKMAREFSLAHPNYKALEYLIRLQHGIEAEDSIVVERNDDLNKYVSSADNGDSRLLSLALRYGADPDGDRTAAGETMLLRSYKLKHRYNRGKFAKILLDHGANPNIPDAEGKTALFYMVAQLQEWDEFPLALKWVVADVAELLHYQADPNIQTPDLKQTPLHVAIASISAHNGGGIDYVLNVIRLLIEHGADPTIKDFQGHDAFGYVEKITNKTKRERILEILM